MATAAEWIEGARLRTLPAAVAPVLAGTGIAAFIQASDAVRALLCLLVSLALQVGVNYANDYSDGIRGTDAERVGPLRLVGSGVAEPRSVKLAAFASFGVAAVAGLVLVLLTQQWWLLGLGVVAIASAWFYTGGKHPYGYLGLGEVFVFVFFGLMAVGGTIYAQALRVPVAGWVTAATIGLLACAILVANNLRDINGDRVAGKRTLAARLGDPATRTLLLGILAASILGVVGVASLTTWWALLGLLMVPLLIPVVRAVRAGALGPQLIVVLKRIGQAELVCALGLFVGLMLGTPSIVYGVAR
ncbi:MAG TPA: 1,4-dihydroxy-2-naphthoate polyprenyltransferase [Propionibacteriaceae bacterium]|nr:1,4-dihydroxy-2-naphthoate polyprenyltransferase [Micropruina sp.]HBX80810.1 1,4-dihydroxy-2-naphthoate polyprenyltransferase [Propionibacteriaceae bacterium]HBY23247.1 1,4-dihydroxy-2-naphthoate polyprenyltransferase [Propionibacteriaceae bacterium]